jgi:hypothetical protein
VFENIKLNMQYLAAFFVGKLNFKFHNIKKKSIFKHFLYQRQQIFLGRKLYAQNAITKKCHAAKNP